MITKRSEEKELIDLGPAYFSAEEYAECMKKMFLVNRLLGFFKRTVKLLKRFSKKSSLLDVGCGNGLFLLHLSQHFPEMKLQGTDICSEAIQLAKQECQHWPNTQVSFLLQQQNKLLLPENSVDIILATLVCHHLSDEELIDFLQQSLMSSRKAVIINDLHRHFLAYTLYALISPLLFRNRLLTHDGLISIKRGFKFDEWKLLLKKAGIKKYQIKWCFPFHWSVVLWKE